MVQVYVTENRFPPDYAERKFMTFFSELTIVPWVTLQGGSGRSSWGGWNLAEGAKHCGRAKGDGAHAFAPDPPREIRQLHLTKIQANRIDPKLRS
jgi:hypothetical protein